MLSIHFSSARTASSLCQALGRSWRSYLNLISFPHSSGSLGLGGDLRIKVVIQYHKAGRWAFQTHKRQDPSSVLRVKCFIKVKMPEPLSNSVGWKVREVRHHTPSRALPNAVSTESPPKPFVKWPIDSMMKDRENEWMKRRVSQWMSLGVSKGKKKSENGKECPGEWTHGWGMSHGISNAQVWCIYLWMSQGCKRRQEVGVSDGRGSRGRKEWKTGGQGSISGRWVLNGCVNWCVDSWTSLWMDGLAKVN